MTIISFDQKILAADSLTSSNDTTSYLRTKIRIVKQTAICTCGDTEDGDRFIDWYLTDAKDEFISKSTNFSASILTVKGPKGAFYDDEAKTIRFVTNADNKHSIGNGPAVSYSEGLMRECKWNAHKACEAASLYDRFCGAPVYSITIKQLKAIPHDFDGFWIGTYKVPTNKIKDYLINYKQWLRT
jgi:hypothetical protein